jgi:adenosylmethionine-8-amino-7-oxononanoate aminotransferase
MPLTRDDIVRIDKARVWHPYTPMQSYIAHGEPVVVARAQGSRIFDKDGRCYLDGNSSWWTSLLGHNHPRLVAAMMRQLEEFAHVPLADITHEPAALLAEELIAVAPPGLSRVFYSDNGSTAVEAAVKMSAQYFEQRGERRTKFLSLGDAFHGETLGVTALGGVEAFRRPFSALLMDVEHLPSPALGVERALSALRNVLEREGRNIAGFVVEPLVQGAGGMLMYGAEYLRWARDWTREFEVHLIVDEVFTGYGRTGTMWAAEQAQIEPDLLCLAKGLSGGMLPFGATLVSEEVFRGFDGDASRAFLYGHTYCGNPLAAEVAREVLRVYADEDIVAGVAARNEALFSLLEPLEALPEVANLRSRGLVFAFDLKEARAGYLARAGWHVYEEAKKRGALVRPLGNVVYLAPALNIPMSELLELGGIVVESVRAVLKSARREG